MADDDDRRRRFGVIQGGGLGPRPNPNWAADAKVIEGGGESPAPIDYTRWMDRPLSATDEELTGIADRHFPAFVEVARRRNSVIVVRQTKAACLPWVKRNYPAKPSAIDKVKNSRRTGLVTCSVDHPRYSFEEQVEHAWEAGYYVLEAAGLEPGAGLPIRSRMPGALGLQSHMPGALPYGPKSLGQRAFERNSDTSISLLEEPETSNERVFRARCRGRRLDELFAGPPFEAGQVIDPSTRLPLTGDYDLMGVFPAGNPRGKALTLVHDASAPASATEEIRPGVAALKMRENPYVNAVVADLNALFGGRPRIMHGSHDLKFDPNENNEDGCAVFTPTLAFWIDSDAKVQAFYAEIGRLMQLPTRGERIRRQTQDLNRG